MESYLGSERSTRIPLVPMFVLGQEYTALSSLKYLEIGSTFEFFSYKEIWLKAT